MFMTVHANTQTTGDTYVEKYDQLDTTEEKYIVTEKRQADATRTVGDRRPPPRRIRSRSGVRIRTTNPHDFQNLTATSFRPCDKIFANIRSVIQRMGHSLEKRPISQC